MTGALGGAAGVFSCAVPVLESSGGGPGVVPSLAAEDGTALATFSTSVTVPRKTTSPFWIPWHAPGELCEQAQALAAEGATSQMKMAIDITKSVR